MNTDPQQGWSYGVPAFRQRKSRLCSSLSLAGASSPNTSLASRTITCPRFDARYLNEICFRPICLIFPFGSITVISVTTSANSAPWQPAFM